MYMTYMNISRPSFVAVEHRAPSDENQQYAEESRDDGRARATAEVPVIVLATFSNSLCAPRANHEPLARFGDVHFHEPDAAECLGEASGDLGVDLAALAEEGSELLETRSSSSRRMQRGRRRWRSSASNST